MCALPLLLKIQPIPQHLLRISLVCINLKVIIYTCPIESYYGLERCRSEIAMLTERLFKAVFDSIPHDLLITKMHAYGFSINAVTFFYSYLKRRKQNARINNTHSVFQILLSGVAQGSILSSLLFKIFINDLYL